MRSVCSIFAVISDNSLARFREVVTEMRRCLPFAIFDQEPNSGIDRVLIGRSQDRQLRCQGSAQRLDFVILRQRIELEVPAADRVGAAWRSPITRKATAAWTRFEVCRVFHVQFPSYESATVQS